MFPLIFREEGGEGEVEGRERGGRERNTDGRGSIDWFLPGIKPAAQACLLTRNRTSNASTPHSGGKPHILILNT